MGRGPVIGKGFPWRGLVIGFCVGLVIVLLTGCGSTTGQNTIKVINATKGFTTEGLVNNMYNCAYDALDTMNRGSGCHRSK